MRFLVTGATGKVGNAVARRLAERGDAVVALVRDAARGRGLLPANVELAVGDVTEPESLRAAAARVDGVFNCMGIFEQWMPDPTAFDRVNAEGARNVVDRGTRGGRRPHRPHLHLRRLPRRARRHGPRGRTRRLPEGDRLRALQAARRGAGARRGRRRDRGRDLQSRRRLRPRPVGRGGARRHASRRAAPTAAGAAAGWDEHGIRRRRRHGSPRGLRARRRRGALHPRRRLCDRGARSSVLRSKPPGEAGSRRPCRPAWPGAWPAAGEAVARLIKRPPLLGVGQLHFLLWEARADSRKAASSSGWSSRRGSRASDRRSNGFSPAERCGEPQVQSPPNASPSASQTRSICASLITAKKGRASRRAEASSATGNWPSRYPNRSRRWAIRCRQGM